MLGMKDDRYYEVIGGLFPSDKVVTSGNYQLQYVTTRKEDKDDAEDSEGADEHAHSDESNDFAFPLQTMGIVLGVLLSLNLMAELFRR